MNGKGNEFMRPAYILRKFSKDGAFIIPMTTQIKDDLWHIPVSFNGKIVRLVFTQMRTMSSMRLLRKMGDMPRVYRGAIEKKALNIIKNSP